MKVIYEFDPIQDAEELKLYQQTGNMYECLHDIYQHLRTKSKYPAEGTLEYEGKLDLEEFRGWFHTLLRDNGVEI